MPFDQITKGWYVLAGTERVYHLPLLPLACAGLDQLEATVKTEDTVVRTKISVDPAGCLATPH